jgi:hypothetical protein
VLVYLIVRKNDSIQTAESFKLLYILSKNNQNINVAIRILDSV